MGWREISPSREDELWQFTLSTRSTLRVEDGADGFVPVPTDQWHPLIVDGKPVHSGATSGGYDRALSYEWSPRHQGDFEELLRQREFDFPRLRRAVADLKGHWDVVRNWGTGQIDWLEPFCEGISSALHQLGKEKHFRVLRYKPYGDPLRSSFDTALGQAELVISMGSGTDEDGWKVPPASERPILIAYRGMAEYIGREMPYEPDEEVACATCGSNFLPQTTHDLDVRRFGKPRWCSLCLTAISNRVSPWTHHSLEAEQSRTAALDAVHLFHQLTQQFPHRLAKKPPVGHLSDEERDRWVRAVMMLPGSETATDLFGGWLEMLAAADVIDLQPRRGQSGYRSVSDDGHVALSLGERAVCDFLHSRNISHEKEPTYPFDAELNPKSALRADWRIGSQLVELAGRMDDDKYAANMARKRQLAARHGLDLLVLLPTDLRRISEVSSEHWES